MSITLKRVSDTPILLPNPDHPWEASVVFNCAEIYAMTAQDLVILTRNFKSIATG
jgi:hypothetical protein